MVNNVMQRVHLPSQTFQRVLHSALGGSELRFLNPWFPISLPGWISVCGLKLNPKWFYKQRKHCGTLESQTRAWESSSDQTASGCWIRRTGCSPLPSVTVKWKLCLPQYHTGTSCSVTHLEPSSVTSWLRRKELCQSDSQASLECPGWSGWSHMTCAWTVGEGSTESR